MAQTKREKAIKAAVVPGKAYAFEDAINILKSATKAKFVESIDVAVRLGVDAKKSDQQVRGSTVLPAGTGKSVRVAVFAPAGAKADEALAAGAEAVGMDDLAEKMQAGDLNYDVVIATPDAMRVVGKLDGPGRHRRPVVADPEVIVSSGHGTFGAVTVTFEGIAGLTSPAVAVKDRRRGRGNTGDGHGSSIWQGVAAGAVMSA